MLVVASSDTGFTPVSSADATADDHRRRGQSLMAHQSAAGIKAARKERLDPGEHWCTLTRQASIPQELTNQQRGMS